MSATEFLEQFRKLPPEEQRAVFEQIREGLDDELSSEQIAELDRRLADFEKIQAMEFRGSKSKPI